jgi:hypothetical protein
MTYRPTPRVATAVRDPSRAVLNRLLWQWLAVGALLWCLFPALRGPSAWLGHGSLWLLALPASALVAFHRDRLAGWLRGR